MHSKACSLLLCAHRCSPGTSEILKAARKQKPELYTDHKFYRGDVYFRTTQGEAFFGQGEFCMAYTHYCLVLCEASWNTPLAVRFVLCQNWFWFSDLEEGDTEEEEAPQQQHEQGEAEDNKLAAVKRSAEEEEQEEEEKRSNFKNLPVTIIEDAQVQRQYWRRRVEGIHRQAEKRKPGLVVLNLGVDGLKHDRGVGCVGKLEIKDYVWAVQRFRTLGCKILIIMEVSGPRQ